MGYGVIFSMEAEINVRNFFTLCLRCLIVTPCFVSLSGCGGGMDQNDMRRQAIRRTRDDDDPQPTSAVAQNAVPSEQPGELGSADPTVRTPATTDKASPVVPVTSTARNVDENSGGNVASQISAEEYVPPAIPTAPLSAVEQREWTLKNFERIGEAWNAYVADKSYLPNPIFGDSNQPLLSWRVELLPYLGLSHLHAEFRLNEAWSSPHNKKLLSKIPPVFQSPARFDSRTNYLAITGRSTLFNGTKKTLPMRVEDGVENTLAIVEVDDELALPWTQPNDLPAGTVASSSNQSLGNLHKNGFFAIWGDGHATWIGAKPNERHLISASTVDSGDGFLASQIALDIRSGLSLPTVALAETADATTITNSVPRLETPLSAPASEPLRPTRQDALASSRKSSSTTDAAYLSARQPIPSSADLRVARELVRELFQQDYTQAQTPAARTQIARTMLNRLPEVSADVAEQYALLDVARQIALQGGDVRAALDATDQIVLRFETKETLLLETFESLGRMVEEQGKQQELVTEATDVYTELVAEQKYALAERLSQLALSVANKLKRKELVDEFAHRKRWAAEARTLFQAAEEGLATLEQTPDDPRANGAVGAYLCLVKQDWSNGLVILAHGHQRSLKKLAEFEQGNLADPQRQLELADLWWQEAERASPAFASTMRARAAHWYQHALPGLPAGLVRIRVERRIAEIEKQLAHPEPS